MSTNVLDEVKRFFRPEFLNRVDGTVVFHSLNREQVDQIVVLMLQEVASSLIEKGIDMEVTDAAKEWLAEKGFDRVFGARPLRRVIQDNVEDKLSDAILAGELGPAATAIIDVEDEDIVVRVESPLSVAPA